MALAYSGTTKKELSERLGIAPSAFSQRLKTGKFKKEELEKIALVLNAEYISYFKFPDGKEIQQSFTIKWLLFLYPFIQEIINKFRKTY